MTLRLPRQLLNFDLKGSAYILGLVKFPRLLKLGQLGPLLLPRRGKDLGDLALRVHLLGIRCLARVIFSKEHLDIVETGIRFVPRLVVVAVVTKPAVVIVLDVVCRHSAPLRNHKLRITRSHSLRHFIKLDAALASS